MVSAQRGASASGKEGRRRFSALTLPCPGETEYTNTNTTRQIDALKLH